MNDRPILFSGPMVRAILSGAKTQTRRIMKPKPDHCHRDILNGNKNWYRLLPQLGEKQLKCPYGQPGDRLWVRETWGCFDYSHDQRAIAYRADGDDGGCTWIEIPKEYHHFGAMGEEDLPQYCPANDKWRPSIHMPRWASRITLEVTEVRVERIRDIDPTDCWAEGMPMERRRDEIPHLVEFLSGGKADGLRPKLGPWYTVDPIPEFRKLWNSINAKRGYGWDVNPWVWVVSFRKSSYGVSYGSTRAT